MKRILIVEDDSHIHELLIAVLQGGGYAVTGAFSGTEALRLLEQERFDLVLLDLMLPGKSGEEVLAEISGIPVIVLTAVASKESTVALLRQGASDYLTKPFDNEELLARIEVQLRGNKRQESLLQYKDLSLDTESFTAMLGSNELKLSKREFAILATLMKNPKKVFTKNNLYASVWGDEFYGDENTVNVHISKIRAKLGEADYIETVWGIGFKMVE